MLKSRTRRTFLLSAAAVPFTQLLAGCASEAGPPLENYPQSLLLDFMPSFLAAQS
jgi:hypothetical protein